MQSISYDSATTFISQSDGGTENFAFGFYSYSDIKLMYGGSEQGWNTYWNTWYYSWAFWSVVITAASDSSSAQIFVNGNLERTFNNFPAYTGTGDLFVGTGSLGDKTVRMDDIFLFTRALSAVDVLSIYGGGDNFDRTGLVFLHRFHHQEPWAWNEGYAQSNYKFSSSTSVFTDPADQGHSVTVTGSFELKSLQSGSTYLTPTLRYTGASSFLIYCR